MGIIERAFAQEITDLSNPAPWFKDWAIGRKTHSGSAVNHTTAMGLSAYIAVLRNGSDDVAKPDREVRKMRPVRGSDAVPTHPASLLMGFRWTPTISAFAAIRLMVWRAMSWGNAHAEIVRDGMGKPIQLWPIHPARMKARMLTEPEAIAGEVAQVGDVVYDWTPDGIGKVVTLPARDIFHIQGPGDGINGMSMLRAGAEVIGIGLAAQEYGARYYGEGATKKMIGMLGEPVDANGRKELRKRILGDMESDPVGRRKLPLIEGDITFTDFGISPVDGQYLETRRYTVEEMARIWRVSMSKMQDNTRAKGWSTTEAENTAYVTDFMLSWTIVIECETRIKLMTPAEQPTHRLKTNFSVLLRGDTKTRTESYAKRFMTASITPNEIREDEGDNPSDEEGADSLYVQSAMVKLENAGTTPASGQAQSEGPSAADRFAAGSSILIGVFQEAALRMCMRESNRLGAAAKKHASNQAAFDRWAEKFYDGHEKEVLRAFAPAVTAMTEMAQDDGIDTTFVDNPWAPSIHAPTDLVSYMCRDPEDRAEELALDYYNSTRDAILEVCDE